MSEAWKQYVAGSMSATVAVVFSNPLDVVKTRMQLQGELQRKGGQAFKNPLQAMWLIFRQEGLAGIQRGLSASIPHQMTMNGLRIGTYGHVTQTSRFFSHSDSSLAFVTKRLALAFGCGFCANFLSSPFYLMKVRFQAFSPHTTTAVGAQHRYGSLPAALSQVFSQATGVDRSAAGLLRGVRALYQGAVAGSLRIGGAGSVQLATYDSSKRLLTNCDFSSLSALTASLGTRGSPQQHGAQETDYLFRRQRPIVLHISAALMSGIAVQTLTSPLDVVSTRLYNQSATNQQYNGVADAVGKILKAEGIRGFYKGALSGWLRVGPHTLCTFVFLEKFRKAFETL